LEKDFFVMVVIGNANYLTWPQHGAADGLGLSQFHSWCLIASTLLATDKTPYIISASDKGERADMAANEFKKHRRYHRHRALRNDKKKHLREKCPSSVDCLLAHCPLCTVSV